MAPTPNSETLIRAFHQSNEGNCASIACIKASMEVFGIHGVVKRQQADNQFTVTLKDSTEISYTQEQLDLIVSKSGFKIGKTISTDEKLLFESVLKEAHHLYATMVAQCRVIHGLNSFDQALDRLNNGANVRSVSKYLGLKSHTGSAYRGASKNKGVMAWQHTPFLKHVVFMSNGLYDDHGNIARNTRKFPKRIQILPEPLVGILSDDSSEWDPLHHINISQNGDFTDSGRCQTFPEEIDALVDYMIDHGKRDLLLYFHGGLVNERKGHEGAIEFIKHFGSIEPYHAVGVVWETGLLEVLPDTLLRTLQSDELMKTILRGISRFIGKRLKLGDIAYPFDMSIHSSNTINDLDTTHYNWNVAFEDFKEDAQLEAEAVIEHAIEGTEVDRVLTDEELDRVDFGDEKFRIHAISLKTIYIIAKVGFRCIRRFMTGRDHGYWPTLIEEAGREIEIDNLGTDVWCTMKKQAEKMWAPHTSTGLEMNVGRYLLDALAERATEEDPLRIHVIGHSAGSIAICEMVEQIATKPEFAHLHIGRVSFLAPAVRVDTFMKKFHANRNRVKHFRMFTMDDEHECKDWMLSIAYTRSLLYFISGMLEGTDKKDVDTPILGLHRHIRNQSPYSDIDILERAHKYLYGLTGDSKVLVLNTNGQSDAPEGWRCDAKKHGKFIENKYVQESLQFYLREV